VSDKIIPNLPPPAPSPALPPEEEVERRSRRLTRRGFLAGGAAALAGLAGWGWLRTRAEDDGIPWPLRRVLRFNERLARAAFREARLAPTFPEGRAVVAADARVNGDLGLRSALDPAAWALYVGNGPGRQRRFTLGDVRALPRTAMVTELKCIEGWSEVVSWAGASFRDFLVRYGLGTRSGAPPDLEGNRGDLYRYVALETPDGGYYVGLDMESALHPQTLLCYEMGGRPLTPEHGAPLRLAIPLKYGIKNLKRIGRVRFTDERPRDYWAERGYDWYAGH
jgi:DMSO/TMAO reductase YedYZ molybdopterin-dependent catalytic subunit